MKLIYSHLKTFLPDLNVPPEQLRDDLTLIGHFTNYFEKVNDDFVLDLDVKINRADCLGYYGLARDLSVLYNLPLQLTNYRLPITDYRLPITVSSPDVIRIQAQKISGINNTTPSPPWLINFLQLHQVNPINLLVDLTNYVMFLYGLPCHAFDTAKSTDNLVWENNQKYAEFITLDNTKLKLSPNVLMVNNLDSPLSLSFLGGKSCAIDTTTTDTIIEMAVYNRTRVRNDSRQLNTTTEAAIRLDKELDPENIPLAFSHLFRLILDLCGGQVSSALFEYYPQKAPFAQINFDPSSPAIYAGINIPSNFALDVLKRLGCQINNSLVTPPSIRKDITLQEDLIEEVIRFYGYNKIPTDQPISNQKLPDITPKTLYLIESLKDQLVSLGYDEVRSWPLVAQPLDPASAIKTENSINSEYPYLRQSMLQSLHLQLEQYQRFKLNQTRFFEIGKIFYKENNRFIEKYALGVYNSSPKQLKLDIPRLVKGGVRGGFDSNFAELLLDNLPQPESYQPSSTSNTAYELTSQIITLDANVNFDSPQNPATLIKKYTALIDPAIFWSISLIDVYQNRYTFRVCYFNCDDKTAKSTHLKTFNLISPLKSAKPKPPLLDSK